MVGHLDEVDAAVVVGLGHEHAVDVQRAVDLGQEEFLVDRAGSGLVGEAGDDDGMVAFGGDRALGDDALVIGELGSDDDDVLAVGGHGGLVGHVVVPSCSASPKRCPDDAGVARSTPADGAGEQHREARPSYAVAPVGRRSG